MGKQIPSETLLDLRRRLDQLPRRSTERRWLVQQTAQLYDVSEATLYRLLRDQKWVHSARRDDAGIPRVISKPHMERYCEAIAALKIRTCNGKGRHLSTVQAIRLLEEHGVEMPEGHLQAPPGLLKKTTVNRYLQQWGYDQTRLTRQPPVVHFQAQHSNDCWHFDLSPSDLKHVKTPVWMDPARGRPLLMLYSVVDDRSGVAYQEYHGVYGEDVEAALRFLFTAMSAKALEDFPFQGIPQMLYMDNGPIARSQVFQNVMAAIGVEVRTHMPQGKDGRRVTARSKGKVERPFRSVKEMHETLYHLHEPETEVEANAWLCRFLLHYNSLQHRHEAHSRMEDWVGHLPVSGVRGMCNWERFCTFAREPETRKVGSDARVTIAGATYEVEPDLAGETVVLWWGLFDNELYVEHQDQRYGPYTLASGPIPLHRYRHFKRTPTQERADRVEALAEQLSLPASAIGTVSLPAAADSQDTVPVQSFDALNPIQARDFPNAVAAKLAIADVLGMPLAKLSPEQLAQIDAILADTLDQQAVLSQVQDYFAHSSGRSHAQ